MRLAVVLCLVAQTIAAPPPPPPPLPPADYSAGVLKYHNDNGMGPYRWRYKLMDGTEHKQEGNLENEGRDDASIAVLKYYNENGMGPYRWGYKLMDGTEHKQEGNLENEGRDDASIAIKGSYSWIRDGVMYIVTYTADKNGYRPMVAQTRSSALPAKAFARKKYPKNLSYSLIG